MSESPFLLRRIAEKIDGPANAAVLHYAADEIERLREAIRFAVEAIDADDIISACDFLSEALGPAPSDLADRWDD